MVLQTANCDFYGNVDIREVVLGFRVGGKLASLGVDEGDPVTKDQILATLDAEPIRLQVEQAKASVASVEAKLLELQHGFRPEEIEQAKANLGVVQAQHELARLNFERQKMLDENEVGTVQLLDTSRTEFEVAKARVVAAQAQLQLLQSGYRQETLAQVQAELDASRAKLAQLETSLSDCELIAPSTGTIRSRIQEVGAIMQPGSPVFVMALNEQPWVRAYVSEANLGKIEPGMKVKLFSDSRPEKPYEGHIGFISPTAEFTPKSVQTEELRTDLVYPIQNRGGRSRLQTTTGHAHIRSILNFLTALKYNFETDVLTGKTMRTPARAWPQKAVLWSKGSCFCGALISWQNLGKLRALSGPTELGKPRCFGSLRVSCNPLQVRWKCWEWRSIRILNRSGSASATCRRNSGCMRI